MTILFISHYAGFYGAAKSLYALMLDLRARYNVTPIVLLPLRCPFCEQLERSGIKYFVCPYYWWVNYDKGIFQCLLNKRKQFVNLFRLREIYKKILNEKIDIVYTNSVTIDIGFLLAKKLKCPHIWHFKESFEQFFLKLSLSRYFSKKILRAKLIRSLF